jgi:phospholipase/carboxylesterase
METEIAGFIARIETPPTPEGAPVVLLHGMGGDEDWLIPFGQAVAPGRMLISLRGRQLWKGGWTFFLRRPDDQLDLDDLAVQLPLVRTAIAEIGARYGTPILIGYSFGAITIAALLGRDPGLAKAAVLLRPMPPGGAWVPSQVTGLPVLMTGGDHDERRAPEDFPNLERLLRVAGADVTAHMLDAGHTLLAPGDDVNLTKAWITGLGI